MFGGKTNLKYLFIVVVLAAIAGGGILAWQFLVVPKEEPKIPGVKPQGVEAPEEVPGDETADWETYTSEMFGWSVKHPKDWSKVPGGPNCTVKGGGETSTNTICFFSLETKQEEDTGFSFQVFSTPYEPDFINECFGLPENFCQELTIAGQKATRQSYEYTIPVVINEEEFYISNPNKTMIILSFIYNPCTEETRTICYQRDEANKLINQILSTFRFLE